VACCSAVGAEGGVGLEKERKKNEVFVPVLLDRRTRRRPTGRNGPVYLADVSCNSRPSRQLPHQAPSLSALGSVLGGPFSIPRSLRRLKSTSDAQGRNITIGGGAAERSTDAEESRYCTRPLGGTPSVSQPSDRPAHRRKRNFGGACSLSCNAARRARVTRSVRFRPFDPL